MLKKNLITMLSIISVFNIFAHGAENNTLSSEHYQITQEKSLFGDFSEMLRKADGFGLPHTIEIKLEEPKGFQDVKEYIWDDHQFSTFNNMGSNVNDLTGSFCYGRTYDLFYEQFSPNSGNFILDIGCGTGHNTNSFLKESTIVFNDICDDHLAFVHSFCHQNPGKGYYLNNKSFPHQIDFPSECFTGIVCSYVGHYLSPKDLEASFQNMTSCLKPGGVIFYRVLTEQSQPFNFYKAIYNEKKSKGEKWPGFIEDVTFIKPSGIAGLPNRVHPHGLKEVNYLAELSGLTILGHCLTGYSEKYTPPGTFMAVLQKSLR